MSLPSLTNSSGNPKTFWQRPEGKTGFITMAALGVGAFLAAKVLLPTILAVLTGLIAMTSKMIVLGGLLVIGAGLLFLAFNPTVHALVEYAFKLSMRKLTNFIIVNDPIGIMRLYITDLSKRLGTMDARLAGLRGQIRSIKEIITANIAKHSKAMSMATQAEEKGMKGQFSLNARKAGRAQNSNLRYEDLLKKMEFLYQMLSKYREASDVMILDMTDEVDNREIERKATLAAYGAMQGARDILAGSGDKRAMYDQAMEYTVADYGAKLGEIEHFMTTSQSFIDGLDLENGAFDADAMSKIQEWENSADSLLLGGAKQATLQTLGAMPLDSAAPASYAKLFK